MSLTTPPPTGPTGSPNVHGPNGPGILSTNNLTEKWSRNTDAYSYCVSAFSPDGKTIARVYQRGVDILDAETGRQIAAMREREHPRDDGAKTWAVPSYPEIVRYSPDGKTLAAIGEHVQGVSLIDTERLQVKPRIPSPFPQSRVGSFNFSPTENLLALGHSMGATIVDLTSGKTQEVISVKKSDPYFSPAVAFSQSGDELFVGSKDRLYVYDLKIKKIIRRYPEGSDVELRLGYIRSDYAQPKSIIHLPNKNLLALFYGSTVDFRDPISLQRVSTIDLLSILPKSAKSMCSNKDGDRLYFGVPEINTGEKNGNIELDTSGIFALETDTGKLISHCIVTGEERQKDCQNIDCSPTGGLLIADFGPFTKAFEA